MASGELWMDCGALPNGRTYYKWLTQRGADQDVLLPLGVADSQSKVNS